jgi:hypothetical protein
MNLTILREKTKDLISQYPAYSEELTDLYRLALDEIEDGSSESHECNLAYSDMLEIINNIVVEDDPSQDLMKEEERNWTQNEIQKEIEDRKN